MSVTSAAQHFTTPALYSTGLPPLRPWLRQELENDSSWIHHLTQTEIQDLESSLRVVLATGKSEFELSAADFPLTPAVEKLLTRIMDGTQSNYGVFLARGFPVERWTAEQMRTMYWCMGLRCGVPRPQGKPSHFVSDVRDAGGQYRGGTGRGYNTNSKLDFHADGSDIVGLMCLQVAKSGGSSLITSSYAAFNALQKLRPDLAEVLQQPFYFGRQGEHAAEEPPYYLASIVGFKNGKFACRHIRNHINGGQLTFPEIPRLNAIQNEAMDLFDELLGREDLCYHMYLQKGDFQFLNNHVNLHARTEYEDFDEPEKRRHLLRLWLSLPQAPALPDSWRATYKDVDQGALRGGFRGANITPEIRAFEKRLSAEHGIAFRIYEDYEAMLKKQQQSQQIQ